SQRTTPTARNTPPSTMSGPAQGVELSRGHEIVMSAGAGCVPSDATSTLMFSGSLRGATTAASSWYWSSQRSEPAGLRVAGAASVPSSATARDTGATSSTTISPPFIDTWL